MTDGLDIPDFLKISAEDRKRAWETFRPRSAAPVEEEWQRRNRLAAEARIAAKKAKNAAALARLKEQHAGERYDRKRKIWVPK